MFHKHIVCLDLLCTWCMQFSINLSFILVSWVLRLFSRKPKIVILKPRIVINKPRIMSHFPRFIFYTKVLTL